MKELDNKNKILIEKLYFEIKAYLESEYDVEGVIDSSKRGSTRIIFKNREKAITMIKEAILNYASKNNVEIDLVKGYLLGMIERDIERDKESSKGFSEEYQQLKYIVSGEGR